jgi:RimJ/RimL family protein N-acetyltransferase
MIFERECMDVSGSGVATGLILPQGQSSSGAYFKRPVLVKRLGDNDRERVLTHFMALQESDRVLRFGMIFSDQMIQAYVSQIDFSRDTVHGVYNRSFQLVGVCHLVRSPLCQTHSAELGISVLSKARGSGVATRLFQRAVIHCRNANLDTLIMRCLATNRAMMHIAKKSGMEIQRDGAEADACLKLWPANLATRTLEQAEDQLAGLDTVHKANSFTARPLVVFRVEPDVAAMVP